MFSHVSNEETSSGDGLEPQKTERMDTQTDGLERKRWLWLHIMAYFWHLCLISGLISVVSLIRCSTFDFNWRCSPYEHLRPSYETTPPQTKHSLSKRHQDREALAMRARARRRANWVSWLWRSTSNHKNCKRCFKVGAQKSLGGGFKYYFLPYFGDGLKPPTIYGVM